MQGLNEFETAVLDMMLAGDHPYLEGLRIQADSGLLSSREYSGTGFFCHFTIPDDAARMIPPSATFGDVTARISGLQLGAGFLVFVRDGVLSMLEGYSYQEPWPDQTENFRLRYEKMRYGEDIAVIKVTTSAEPRYFSFGFFD